MRVAIVHDWLYVLGGAERVLRQILKIYPGADVFTLFDCLSPQDRAWIGYEQSHTSFLQHVPGISKYHRMLLQLMPYAIEQFDFSGYDLVISSSYAVAKGIITGPDQLHVSYVHSPMRYAWDLQHEYLGRGFTGLKGLLARKALHRIRIWDTCSAQRPNAVLANSGFVARRIRKTFGRNARVLYPPVAIPPEPQNPVRGNNFLVAGRLVSYKGTRAVIEAFRHLPGLHLDVAGSGPEERELRAMAPPNVTFKGFVSNAEMRALMTSARALVFAAEEDFGITPLEAQAVGTPVLALGRGGALETIIARGSRRTGMFFESADPAVIAGCVKSFCLQEAAFSRADCRANAMRFSEERFRNEFESCVNRKLEELHEEQNLTRSRKPVFQIDTPAREIPQGVGEL